MSNVVLILIFIILNLFGILCEDFEDQAHLFAETFVHTGYEQKYKLPLDTNNFILVPSYPSGWYAVLLEKRLEKIPYNELVLYMYDGVSFAKGNSLPVGQNDVLKSHKINDELYLMVIGHNITEPSIFCRVLPKFNKIQHIFEFHIPYVSDFVIWSNHLPNELYLLVTISMVNDSGAEIYSTKSPMYYMNSRNLEHTYISSIETQNPLAVSSFSMENMTFIAIANHMNDYGEKNVDSSIYFHNPKTNRLQLYQKLKTYGATAITYFCFSSSIRTEHFLAVTSNLWRGSTRMGSKGYSLIYKWSDGFFVPFQSLDIISPAPFITLVGKKGEFLLLTSTGEVGLVAYQYDGWKFVRSPVLFPYLEEKFNEGRIIDIGYQALFALSWPKKSNNDKNIRIYAPVFKLNTDLADVHNGILSWYNNTSLELKSLKYRKLCNLMKNLERVQKMEFWINNTVAYSNPRIMNVATDNVSDILEKLILDGWVKNITGTSKNVVNFKIIKGKLTISFDNGMVAYGQIKKGRIKFENVTSPPNESNTAKSFHINYRYYNDEHKNNFSMKFTAEVFKDEELVKKGINQKLLKSSQLNAKNVSFKLANVIEGSKYISPVFNKTTGQVKLAHFYEDRVVWYNWNSTRKIFSKSQNKNSLAEKFTLTNFAPVMLKGGVGVYVEGYGGGITGQIYSLNDHGNLTLAFKLPVKELSIVRGVMLHQFKHCFILVSKKGDSCTFSCPEEEIIGIIPCFGISQVFVIGEDEGTDIILQSDDMLSIWGYQRIKNAIRQIEKIIVTPHSIISATKNSGHYYIAISASASIQIYRKSYRGKYSLWKVLWEKDGISDVEMAPAPYGNLAVYTLTSLPANNEKLTETMEKKLISFNSNDTNFVIYNNNNEFNVYYASL